MPFVTCLLILLLAGQRVDDFTSDRIGADNPGVIGGDCPSTGGCGVNGPEIEGLRASFQQTSKLKRNR